MGSARLNNLDRRLPPTGVAVDIPTIIILNGNMAECRGGVGTSPTPTGSMSETDVSGGGVAKAAVFARAIGAKRSKKAVSSDSILSDNGYDRSLAER